MFEKEGKVGYVQINPRELFTSANNAYIFFLHLSFPRMISRMPSIFPGCSVQGTSFINKTKSVLSK